MAILKTELHPNTSALYRIKQESQYSVRHHYFFPIAANAHKDYNDTMVTYLSLLGNPAQFTAQLKFGLESPLPGRQAQLLMAPTPRRHDPEPGVTPHPAAILLPLFVESDKISVILIKRKNNLNHHAGEISFPGGVADPQDADVVHTALREAHEEVGILPEQVDVLGRLTPLYISPSQNMVYPVVGWLKSPPTLTPNPSEVEQILPAPLALFMRAETLHWQTQQREGQPYIFPCYMLGEECVWGATAMILSELLSLICDLEYESLE